jgi:hypothetical protein
MYNKRSHRLLRESHHGNYHRTFRLSRPSDPSVLISHCTNTRLDSRQQEVVVEEVWVVVDE